MRAAGNRGFRCWFGSRKEEFSIVGVSWKVGSEGLVRLVRGWLNFSVGINRKSGSRATALQRGFANGK